jgi:hypothetical protein
MKVTAIINNSLWNCIAVFPAKKVIILKVFEHVCMKTHLLSFCRFYIGRRISM